MRLPPWPHGLAALGGLRSRLPRPGGSGWRLLPTASRGGCVGHFHLMKNLATVLGILLLAMLVGLLWRLDGRLAPMAELARVQLLDRDEARQAEQARLAARERARLEAAKEEQALAEQKQAAVALTQQRDQETAARAARLSLQVKPGEKVDQIFLDNHSTVRDAVVVSVQASSVSFKVGARLYNVPTEKLPEDLQARVRNMFPSAPRIVPESPAQP